MVTPIFRKIKRFQTKSDALTQKVYLLAKTPLLAPKPKDNETNEEETTRLHVDLFPTFTKFIRTSPNRLAVALVLALAAVLQTPGSAFAARYILHHAGFALNTNNNFSRIDGEPRMSIYRTNYNDPDQQFEFIPVGSTVMLKHRSTGKCLNAYRPRNGGTVNVWNCNPNDPEQLWDLLHKSGTIYLIRAHGTNFCIDNYNRIDEGNVHAWECNFNNPNQLWDVHDVVTGAGYVGNVAPSQTYKVRLENLQYKQPLRLIRTGGYYAGRQWQSHEFVFTRVGELRAGALYRLGEKVCNDKWNNLQPVVAVTRQAQITSYNSNTQTAEVEAEVAGKGVFKGIASIGARLRGLIQQQNQGSRTNQDTIEFEMYYKADINGSPILNPTYVWYDTATGLCIVNSF